MFKVGDKVICIDVCDSYDILKKGDIYTIIRISNNNLFVWFDYTVAHYWDPARFKNLRKEKLEKILCIK